MSSEFIVSDDVKELVDEIIKKNNWGPVTDVKYHPGTEAGDGYVSNHVAIDIIREDKIIRLFAKYALNIQNLEEQQLDKVYANEAYFYDVIYPAYVQFLKKRKVDNGFQNVPKCYGTSTNSVIVLENIKEKGYALFNRKEIMNDNHITLALKTFAKFHAISFAFKEQEREKYDKLVAGIGGDFMGSDMDELSAKMMGDMIKDGISKLDPETDKNIIEKCDYDVLFKSMVDSKSYLNEYSILTQGDCWCNNMMFLYEKQNKECPTNVVLVDWQMCRVAPPVLDVSFFFYTIASEESLNKLDFYLKCYYAELSNQIKILGSDPDKLYPFSVFQNHWKQYCKYGFAMAFMVCKMMLINQDEVTSMEEMQVKELEKADLSKVFGKFNNEDEYMKRIRILGEFMVNNNYL